MRISVAFPVFIPIIFTTLLKHSYSQSVNYKFSINFDNGVDWLEKY
jgi:hypothetical protein